MTTMIDKTAETIIAEVEKNSRERWRFTLSKFNNFDLLHVRSWVIGGAKDGSDVATRNGMSCRVSQVPALIEALRQVETEAHRRGLLDGGQA